jgi:RNA polymerase sigma factor (TIGR02999 family)
MKWEAEVMDDAPSLTKQLQSFAGCDREIAEAVLREILPTLHQVAVRELRRERYVAPLSPTELINEVWLRSLRKGGWQINSREHFYAIAALAMRRVLVDFARQRLAQRRGDGEKPEQLDETASLEPASAPDTESVVRIGILMEQMDKANPEAARIVDMHYFAGFTLQEIAEVTGLTFRQVRHLWERGRDWLKDRIGS